MEGLKMKKTLLKKLALISVGVILTGSVGFQIWGQWRNARYD